MIKEHLPYNIDDAVFNIRSKVSLKPTYFGLLTNLPSVDFLINEGKACFKASVACVYLKLNSEENISDNMFIYETVTSEVRKAMSEDITIEILVKSGFKQNPDKTWIYEMTGTSNFNVARFGRKRYIEVETERFYKCYEVRIYHEDCGLISLVDVKTIGQFNTLMGMMDINVKLKKE